jgi:hypothetical protein
MKEHASKNSLDKEAMKALRAERKEAVDRASAIARKTRKELKAVREHLAGSNATVPEIAQAVGLPSARTLWLVASMKKFGEIVEVEKDGDFYRYTLVGSSESPRESERA